MSLCWRMNREDKPVYMEGDKVVSLYVVAFEREGGKIVTVPKKPDEELWYQRIASNFIFLHDQDLTAQPSSGVGELTNLGIGPEKKRRAPTVATAPKMSDADKAQSSKAKNVRGETKGKRHSSDSWCDYVVVSDSLEDLAPAVVRRPKSEPRDTVDIPPSNPDDPIDLESSPVHLLRKKSGKRKQTGTGAEGQPVKKVQKKKITRRGNLDAFITKPVLEKPSSHVPAEPSSVVNEDLPPSPPRAPINEHLESTEAADNEAEKTAGAGNPEVEKPADVAMNSKKVNSPETTDVDVGHPQSHVFVVRDSEKGKSAHEIPITSSPSAAFCSVPENIEKNPGGNQGSFIKADENSPIRPDENPGDYYYRCYSEKQADEIHAPMWKLKKGDTFSDWNVCREWMQGTFPPREIKFQEGRPHEQTYHAYLEEAASYTSTTHRIVREWHGMHKEWAAFKASKKKATEDEARATLLRAKLEGDQAKFAGWKRKAEAEAALLSNELKNWKEICEKDNAEKMSLRNVINNLKAVVEMLKKQDAEIEKLKKEKAEVEAARDEARSHRERSEQRELHTYATLALRDKEIEELIALLSAQEQLKAEVEAAKKDLKVERSKQADTSRRPTEIEEKLENSETARALAESELESLKCDMLWLKEHGIASVDESVLNSEELDKTVAHLLVVARNDGYAHGYAECSHHVVNALKVNLDTSKSATHGVNVEVSLATAKTQFNNLQLPVMDLINVALQSEDHVAQLKEIFPIREEDEDEDRP
ncbi:hypothetical protein Hanom_Chr17g01577081 [Helianthus anomalus]